MIGAPGRNRTYDRQIRRLLLYPLSYGGRATWVLSRQHIGPPRRSRSRFPPRTLSRVTRWVLAHGLRTTYETWGDPEAPPLLLLHGLCSSAEVWDSVAPALAANHHVLAPNARGHVDSGWPGQYGFDQFRDDVVGFLDALAIDGCDVVGHSMGALTAYLLAATRGDRVRRLVLEDMPPPDGSTPLRDAPRGPAPGQPYDWRAVVEIAAWRTADHPDWWAMAPTIGAPTLVLGGVDSHLPQDRLRDLTELIPNASFVSFATGHGIHLEDAGGFLTVVGDFLASRGTRDGLR